MANRVVKGFFAIAGCILGFVLAVYFRGSFFTKNFGDGNIFKIISYYVGISILFGIILFLLSPAITNLAKKVINYIESYVQKVDIIDLLLVTISAIVGLIVAVLISSLLKMIAFVGLILTVIAYIMIPIIFATVAMKKKDEIILFTEGIKRKQNSNDEKIKKSGIKTKKINTSIKVLDTSVIIDGRIFDLCKTGFIEGKLVIPNFILDELRHIADSADGLKRNRGRRGLDILNKIQKELDIEVEITDKDYIEIQEVDAKLLKLTQDLKGKVLTNDYNLNKVAEVQGVFVLNINELANAIKPVVLPGEKMKVQVVKEGKEHHQGIAYLDDGTMIVVEGAKKKVGEFMTVDVTSVLQTAAGRMIFANMEKG